MTGRDNTGRPEAHQELAFLEEGRQHVERQLAGLCADLDWRRPDLEDSIREARRCPYGEESPSDLPVGMCSRLGQLKREAQLLEWLREVVSDVPLSFLLWKASYWTMELAATTRADTRSPTYSAEWWELRGVAETLRRLERDWLVWNGRGTADDPDSVGPTARASVGGGLGTNPKTGPATAVPRGAPGVQADVQSVRAGFKSEVRGLTKPRRSRTCPEVLGTPIARGPGGEGLLARLWIWLREKLGGARAP
jgi:hypothetical protein